MLCYICLLIHVYAYVFIVWVILTIAFATIAISDIELSFCLLYISIYADLYNLLLYCTILCYIVYEYRPMHPDIILCIVIYYC